ncbi:MAG: hypothetical protein ACI9EF_001859 [Pseudohongiellaceae bacterium]|jgi:hypothetical protein
MQEPDPAQRRPHRAGKAGAYCTLGIVCVLLLNTVVYAGASLGNFRWRLEHGRLLLQVAQNIGLSPEAFFVAPNSEPLRFTINGDWSGMSSWWIALPLWVPFVFAAGWWIRSRRVPSQDRS